MMKKKDFKTRHAAARRRTTPAEARRRLVFGVSIVGSLFVVGGLVAAGWSHPQVFQHWVSASRQHLHHDIAKVKQLAANKKEGPPPIQFEFYTALPKMQVGNALLVSKPVITASQQNKPVFVSAHELEKEFSAHIKQVEANKKRQ